MNAPPTPTRPSRRRAAARRRPATEADPGAPDAELVARLRAGDPAAYTAWVRAETPRLLGATRRILRNEEDARDAVQDAFLQAFRALSGFAGEARLSTWLHRIAINAALMRLRWRRRRPESPIDELLPRFDEDGHRVDAGPAWPSLDEGRFERGELREVLVACFDRLPETHRLVLLLRDVEGLDTAEAGAALGIRTEAVKMRLHRARQALRTLIEPYVLEGVRPEAGPPRGSGRQAGRTARMASTSSAGALPGRARASARSSRSHRTTCP